MFPILPNEIENIILSFLEYRKYYKRKRCFAITKNGKVCKNNCNTTLCHYHSNELIKNPELIFWHKLIKN